LGNTVVMHWNARELRPRHRDAIYSRNHLRERLSLVSESTDRSLLAVNVYRHDEQPAFSDHAIEAVGRLGRPLLACVTRHLALQRPETGETPARTVLESLTGREYEVCVRLLKGWTYEGIAADLTLSAGTVKTYRDRAFERLKIHHRNELFALVREQI
jgi:DNA-binding NarL/FixJ family response regulator